MTRLEPAAEPSLLNPCARPGCPGLVVEPCGDCLRAFGAFISRRRADYHPEPHPTPVAPPPITQQPDEKRRRNQTCWMCEQRRTCRRRHHGGECDQCIVI